MDSQKTTDNSKLKRNSSCCSSGRFLLCFRPPGIVYMDVKSGPGGQVRQLKNVLGEPGGLTDNSMRKKQDISVVYHRTALPSDSLSEEDEVEENGVVRKKKKCRRRKLIGIVKAVLFETSLAKKIRKRKNRKKGDQCTKSENSSDESNSTLPEFFDYEIETNLSHPYPSFRSSFMVPLTYGHSSSLSSNFKSSLDKNKSSELNVIKNEKEKHEIVEEPKKWFGSSKINYCLIFISLLVLVLWGKVCAIVCTSTWLYFVPHWNHDKKIMPENVTDSSKFDSKEYKKKIVIEGLLERDHSRGS